MVGINFQIFQGINGSSNHTGRVVLPMDAKLFHVDHPLAFALSRTLVTRRVTHGDTVWRTSGEGLVVGQSFTVSLPCRTASTHTHMHFPCSHLGTGR